MTAAGVPRGRLEVIFTEDASDVDPPRNLDGLMTRLAEGDRSAFPAIDLLLRRPIERLCRSLLTNPADADDATQNALEKILFRASSYDSERPALPWALSVASFECRTLLRRQQRRREVAEIDEEACAGIDVEEFIVQEDLAVAVQAAMQELPLPDRQALVTAFWQEEGRGPRERKRKQRAIARLRGLWRRLNGD